MAKFARIYNVDAADTFRGADRDSALYRRYLKRCGRILSATYFTSAPV
jgi:hypothetical protein